MFGTLDAMNSIVLKTMVLLKLSFFGVLGLVWTLSSFGSFIKNAPVLQNILVWKAKSALDAKFENHVISKAVL